MATEQLTGPHTLYFCYIDESGTSGIPGNTSHFVLCGLTIPIYKWQNAEDDIDAIKKRYDLYGKEIHTGWLIRTYKEQDQIPGFETLSATERRSEVDRLRKIEIYRLQKAKDLHNQLKQTKKNYEKTSDYTHLTFQQRKDFVFEIAEKIGSWAYARIFAECIDKVFFDPANTSKSIDEQAFEQIVTRFEFFLSNNNPIEEDSTRLLPAIKNYGILIHDNNQTVAKRHTEMMKHYRSNGTSWMKVDNIIETPLFVDSSLTSMIQLTDVCAYAIRRYLENGEDKIFNEIYKRADANGDAKVGIRHFSEPKCQCLICKNNK